MHTLGFLLLISTFSGILSCTKANTEYRKCNSEDCSVKKSCLTIFQIKNHGGWYQCLTFNGDECQTLNDWWIGSGSRVSSVDNHNTCVRIYEHPDCLGFSVELQPGKNYKYLSSINFDEETKSVSSCQRKENYKECEVKVLFSKTVSAEKVFHATKKIIELANGIWSPSMAYLTELVPNSRELMVETGHVIHLFDRQQTFKTFLSAHINSALAGLTASQMSAKMHAVGNRLKSLLSPTTPLHDKRIDLGLAIHTCEEIKSLFEDEYYIFNLNKVLASPYLVAFSSVYLSVAKLAFELRPDMNSTIQSSINQLARLNEYYLEGAIKQRQKQFAANKYVVQDKLVCPEKPTSDSEECQSYNSCYYMYQCDRCIANIRKSIDRDIFNFFQPIVQALEQFPDEAQGASF